MHFSIMTLASAVLADAFFVMRPASTVLTDAFAYHDAGFYFFKTCNFLS